MCTYLGCCKTLQLIMFLEHCTKVPAAIHKWCYQCEQVYFQLREPVASLVMFGRHLANLSRSPGQTTIGNAQKESQDSKDGLRMGWKEAEIRLSEV